MTRDEAIAEATRRGRQYQECIIVFYNPDMMSPDWRNRYQASRQCDRPAHGNMVGQYNPRTNAYEELIRD